jgi:SMI1 / KNR4 family (SUKH-1)
VTDADLNLIEAQLGIALPNAYRELMRTRADELKGYTYEIRGEPRGWFDDLLYLDPHEVVRVNLSERQPDAGTEYAFPDWSKTFVLVGTNGGGDYYCLRLAGDDKVWMIGSDCGDQPSEQYPTLAEYVDTQIEEYHEEEG